jgi:hypothetical protein
MFTGTPVVKKISDRLYRITEVSLDPAAVGTIGLDGGTGDIDLSTPEWGIYATVSLQDAVQVQINANAVISDVTTPSVVAIKSGSSLADFLITVTNNSSFNPTGDLEIYVEFH